MRYAVSIALAAAIATSLGSIAGSAEMKIPAYIQSAVGDQTRPAKDRERDAARKPAEAMAFAGIKPGQKILELMPSRGYYTRLLCRVVGPSGHIYGDELTEKEKADAKPAVPAESCANVSADIQGASDPKFPADLDVVWTSENYHDLKVDYWVGGIPDTKKFDAAVFKSLKPGGVFIVEDHVAEAGSGARDVASLHRIDPELVKQEVTSAGFVFAGESKILSNPADDHKGKVFGLKGGSDKFLYKFRKP